MKQLLLLTFSFFLLSISIAQTAPSKAKAFKLSYEHESSKDYAAAISTTKSVHNDSSYITSLRLGWLYYLSGNLPESVKYYTIATKIQPNSVEAKLGLIYPLQGMGEWKKITETYKSIIAIDSNNTIVQYNLAQIYFVNFKMTKDALPHAEVVVKLYPFDYFGNLLLGQIYLKLGKLDKAKEYLLNAYYYDPDSTEVNKALRTL